MGGESRSESGGARGHGRRAGPSTLTPPTGLPAAPDDASALGPPRPAPPGAVVDPCVCRHGREVHEHWRRGTDCGICGQDRCGAYRREGGALRGLLRRLRLVR